jgi:integrase
LDEHEAAIILEKLEGEPLKYRTLFTLLLYTGMRRGEICGLAWNDIDMQSGIIDINKSSLYLPGKGVFDDQTKNVSSTRIIKVSRSVLALLQEYRAEQLKEMLEQGTAWQGERDGNCKVFTQSNGKPIHPHSVTLWFEKFVDRHNLPSACVHSLRHTNASLMIAAGVDLRTVSKRLGHAQMSTTSNIYAHAIRTADEMAADTLDDILNPKASAGKRKA